MWRELHAAMQTQELLLTDIRNCTCKLFYSAVAKYSNSLKCWEPVLRPFYLPFRNASFSEHTRTCPRFLIQHLNAVTATATALGDSSISQASLWTHVWKIHTYWLCVHRMVWLSSEQNGNHVVMSPQGAWTLSLHHYLSPGQTATLQLPAGWKQGKVLCLTAKIPQTLPVLLIQCILLC